MFLSTIELLNNSAKIRKLLKPNQPMRTVRGAWSHQCLDLTTGRGNVVSTSVASGTKMTNESATQ